MTPPPIKKTLEGVLTDTRERLDLVERRLAKGTGGSGSDLEPTYDSGWVEAKTTVVWATGWSISGSTPSVKFRRVGAVVQMVVLYAMVAPGTFSIPVHGNVGNSDVFSGIPAEFRPAPGTQGAATTGNTGPTATFTISDAGTLQLAAMTPDATQTGSVSNLVNYFTIVGTWLADGSKPLGPGAEVAAVEGAPPYDAMAGLISAWDSNSIPSGWLLCDGSLVSRAGYPDLFAAIGTIHGAGDGSTTFALPNYKGRTLVGRDPAQTEFDVLGESGGAKTHTLTEAEIPAHTHGFAGGATLVAGNGSSGTLWQNAIASGNNFRGTSITNTGGGGAHNNLQPYAVVNYIISTGSGVGGGGSSVPALPDPWAGAYNATVTLNDAAATWVDMHANLVYTVNLPYPLWVDVELSGYLVGVVGAYGMFGVEASGALVLGPEVDQITGNTTWFGYTGWGEASPGRTTSVHKHLLLPAGTTTLKMRRRRSTANGTPSVGYPTMIVTPRSWVGAPGASQNLTRGTTAQRDTVYGVPANAAAQSALANQVIEWFNTDKGYTEIYYATTGTAGLVARGLLAGHASGWYPAAGADLYARRGKNNGYQVIAQNNNVDPVLATMDINRGGFADNAGSGIVVPAGGRYQVHGSVYYTGGTAAGSNTHWCRLFNNGVLQHDNLMARTMSADQMLQVTGIMTVVGGTAVAVVANTQAASVNVYGTNGFQTWIEVTYLGPPLVNG